MITKPKGTYDVIEKEALKLQKINRLIEFYCNTYNYDFIRTPIFESRELFHRAVGDETDIVTKETYDFKDRSERELTLRPEGTAGVVRSFIENKLYGSNLPRKFYYTGTMYRYERPGNGRNREFTQFGVEILGSNDPLIDAEIISMPYNLFQDLGFKDLIVKINNLGTKEDRENYKRALKEYLSPHIHELCEDCKRRYETNPLRILDCKVDQDTEILKNVPNILDYQSEESKTRFNKVKEYLNFLDVDYEVDSKLVRGLDYYDFTVFEIVLDTEILGGASTIAAGGRYNSLVENLDGPKTPCIGFACGLERIMLAMDEIEEMEKRALDCYILYVNEEEKLKAMMLAQDLRISGVSVDYDTTGRSLKSQFKEADRNLARLLIILNSEDLKKGLINVKDNLTKEEVKIDENEIIDYIISNG
ncbi:MAG: histidine--tRNA ligase [Bacilli bacterium]|nr:histidine--tRNA ligase [Bacilli bacterium]